MKKLWERIKKWAKHAWSKIKKAAKKAEEKIIEAAEYCTAHPEVIYIAGVGMSLVTTGIKRFAKSKTEREQDYQRTHIYDYSLGHHWTLRRELTGTEMKEYKRRKESGEAVGDILESMRVLA